MTYLVFFYYPFRGQRQKITKKSAFQMFFYFKHLAVWYICSYFTAEIFLSSHFTNLSAPKKTVYNISIIALLAYSIIDDWQACQSQRSQQRRKELTSFVKRKARDNQNKQQNADID